MGPISVTDMFKIGLGPSSSHTLGPWKAAQQFLNKLGDKIRLVKHVRVILYASLAKTGRGHGTDMALMLGLSGEDPELFDTDKTNLHLQRIKSEKNLLLAGQKRIAFDHTKDIVYEKDTLPDYHPNALTFDCVLENGEQINSTYYSIGGGFVVKEGEENQIEPEDVSLPYHSESAVQLVEWCSKTGKSISEIVRENEKAWRPEAETKKFLMDIWKVMRDCIYNGCHHKGELPGGLQVLRRAPEFNSKIFGEISYEGYEEWTVLIRQKAVKFPEILDWVNCFALAVNEENASFGRVVTAPTNGAAGVVPAVIQYMITFTENNCEEKIFTFLLCASEIGTIFKRGATISAAMGGCQAEIGVSAAMAAAALTECNGGTPEHCLMAAEIAMEHHLGLTCDPIGGLVQIPCIERNAMGAVKAISASQMALNSDPSKAKVSLDAVVKTMWETALDMNAKYKETSEGGLAVNIPVSLSEC